MHAVFDAVLPVFGLIGVGSLAARCGLFDPAMTDALNRFVIWLALPALLFGATARMRWADIDHADFLAAFGGGMAITFVLSLVLDRRRDHRLADRAIEGLDAAYGNTGFLGIPLGLALYGPALLPAFIIATLLTACALFAVAIVLIEIDIGRAPSLRDGAVSSLRHGVAPSLHHSAMQTSRALLANPLLVAPVAGALLPLLGLALPVPLSNFLTLLGAAAGPCALVAIGLFLAEQRGGPADGAVGRLVGLKLVLQPALTYAIAWSLAMPAPWLEAALLMAALPIGTGPFMLAKLYGRNAATTSRAILLSTILSLFSVAALVLWIKG